MQFILSVDRKLPPNLFKPRRIGSTADADRRFFPHGRIPLLLPVTAQLPSWLKSAGAAQDERGVFVRQGAAINLSALDPLLPFAARQTITPVLGDLIPATSWGSSLANLLTKASWDELRQRAFRKTGFRCETCGTDKNLECHELWEYHEPLPEYLEKNACGLQRLIRLMALCADCHETHHLGLANLRGRGEQVSDRIRACNRWTTDELEQYCALLEERYTRRCEYTWLLDVSCVASARLVVRSKWQSDENGFLCATTKTGLSETMLLGAAWFRDGVCYPAVSPLIALLEGPPPITTEWKQVAGHLP
jgi:hypothetical protein